MSRPWLLIIFLLLAVWQLWPDRLSSSYSVDLATLVDPVRVAPIKLSKPPRQRNIDRAEPLRLGDLEIQLRAEFRLAARVLSRRDYSRGRWGDLIPLDLALGWGPMSDPVNLAAIDIRQSGRFYSWRVERFPIPRSAIEQSSANIHIIVGRPELLERLDQIEQGDTLRLGGYLVDVDYDDGAYWRTSMTRSDTGGGACELFLVTDMTMI